MEYVRGRTNTAEALKLLYSEMFTPFNGDRVDIPNYGIVITDGESNINEQNTLPEAIAARWEQNPLVSLDLTNLSNRYKECVKLYIHVDLRKFLNRYINI